MSQKAYPAVTLKEVYDLENKSPDEVILVEFKLERNGSVSISTSDYVINFICKIWAILTS